MPNPEDPRLRRTRTQLHAAVRDLLTTDPRSLTFARVAATAQLNRSTVHQHYDDLHELVTDALAADLKRIAEPLDRCPFDGPRGAPPPELVEIFAAVRAQQGLLDRLSVTDSRLVTDRLRGLLADLLKARFAAGARPAGFGRVPAHVHADYIAGGLSALLMEPGSEDLDQRAGHAWDLITGRSRATRSPGG